MISSVPLRARPADVRGSVATVSLQFLDRIREIDRESGVLIVEAGATVGTIRQAAQSVGLWCPGLRWLPPNTLIGAAIAGGHGWRSRGYGAVPDYLLGLRFVCPSSGLVRHGGKAIKNASGYNLSAAVAGSRGALGVILEATLRLVPRPVARAIQALRLDSTACWSLAVELARISPGADAIILLVQGGADSAQLIVEIEDPAAAVVRDRLAALTDVARAYGAEIDPIAACLPAPGPLPVRVARWEIDPSRLAELGPRLAALVRRVQASRWVAVEATGGAIEVASVPESDHLTSAIPEALGLLAHHPNTDLRQALKRAFDPAKLLVTNDG